MGLSSNPGQLSLYPCLDNVKRRSKSLEKWER